MSAHELQTLPDELAAGLRRLNLRVRGLAVMRGAGVLCVVMGVGLASGLLIDWAVDVGIVARTALLIGAMGAILVTLAGAIVRPLVRRTTSSELAALVDTAYPELGERIESAVELSDVSVPERHRGSSLMRSRLLDETARRAETVDFRGAAEASTAIRWMSIGALCVMLLLAPFVPFREGYGLLWARYLTPWRNLERATNLTFVIENGDRFVARGTDVSIVARPHWRVRETALPDHVWVRWQGGSGERDDRRMRFDGESQAFQATIPHVLTSFDYDVSAGRTRTRTYHIHVVEAPAIEHLTLEIESPAYTNLPVRMLDGPAGRIDAFRGSRLKFQAAFSKPVVAAALRWRAPDHEGDGRNGFGKREQKKEQEQEIEVVSGVRDDESILPFRLDEDGRSGTLLMTAGRGGLFDIELRDRHDVANTEQEPWELVIISDQPPSIAWADGNESLLQPGATLEVRPGERVSLPVVAEDDIGVAELELHAEIVQRSESLDPLSADGRHLGHAHIDHTFLWDLAPFSLQEGDLLAVRARAVDGRPQPGPQEAWTPSRLIRITAAAESLEKRELAREQQRLRDILEAIRQNVQQDRATTDSLRTAARAAIDQDQPPSQRAEIAQLAQREQDLMQRLEQLAAVFAEHPLQRNMAEDTGAVGSGPIDAARARFQQAESSPPEQQLEQLTQAADELARAEGQLTDLLQTFDELAALEQDLQRLQQLAEQAERLSDDVAEFEQQWDQLARAEELTDEQKQTVSEALGEQHHTLQTDQESLAGGLDRLLEERPEVLQAATEQQLRRLRELGEQASRLAAKEDRLADVLEQEPDVSVSPEGQESPAENEDRAPVEDAGGDLSEPIEPADDLTERQRQLAANAARLALETARNRGIQTASAQQAREFAATSLRAAEEAETGLLQDAADSADAAAEAGHQTAAQLNDPTDPAPAQLRAQAEGLAEQQAALADELREQSSSRAARREAQADGQQQLAEQTSSLAEQLQQIAERFGSEPLNDAQQSGRAGSAGQSAEEAQAAMQSAQGHLQQGRTPSAVPQARAAAESLRTAATQAGLSAEESTESSPVPGEVGEQVADARWQLQQAGKQLRQTGPSPSDTGEATDGSEQRKPPTESDVSELPEPTAGGEQSPGEDGPSDSDGEPQAPPSDSAERNASQSMKQVAESLKQAARQLGMAPSPSGQPGDQEGEPSEGAPGSQSGNSGKNPISLIELEAELRKMSTRNWGQLPGRVESELLQSTQKKPDGEYARLIRLYFEEISRRRSAAEGLVPNDNEL